MGRGHWPVEVWKFGCTNSGMTQPLTPFWGTHPPILAEYNATSASDITAVHTRYAFTVMATVVLDAAGKTPVGPAWFADLNPCYRIYNQVSAPPPYESPFGAGFGETTGVSDDGFDLAVYDTPVDNATGHATQTAVWTVRGSTEGMRKLAGPVTSQMVATFGFNYNSYCAGYAGLLTNVTWNIASYMKTLFGSATSIT